MNRFKISIGGMHCASCSSNVERSLKKVPGIKDANVNVLMEKGYVDCDGSVTEKQMTDAVLKTGCTVRSIEKN